MKITVELPGALLRSVKKYTAAHGMTMREVIETGLRHVLASGHAPSRFSPHPQPRSQPASTCSYELPSDSLGWRALRQFPYFHVAQPSGGCEALCPAAA